MKLATTEGQPVDWASDFVVGSVAEGQVHEVKDYGIVCDLDSHPVRRLLLVRF